MICSVVKSNAYGHGMCESAEALSRYGTDYLGTANYSESITLRNYLNNKHIRTPILCLGLLTEDKKFFEDIAESNIEVTISDIQPARWLNNFAISRNKKINVHIKSDTGMNRIGFPLQEVAEAANEISRMKGLKIKGIFSHLATSETPGNAFAKKQIKIFKKLISELEASGIKFEIKHIENSGGIINFRDDYFNLVRPGIALYGYYPDKKLLKKNIGIEPVMTLKSKVSFIKKVTKGNSISYGRKYFTKKDTMIGSIPAGYGDGYSRLLSNKSKAIINGKKFNTVGTICMDWVMADLGTRTEIKVNDEVILLGKEYPAYNHAEIMKTIPYEITCNISSRVQRVYKE